MKDNKIKTKKKHISKNIPNNLLVTILKQHKKPKNIIQEQYEKGSLKN